jgi:hypothetical protein
MEILRREVSKALMSMGYRILPPDPEHEAQVEQEKLDKQTKEFFDDTWEIENTFKIPTLLDLITPQERDIFHQSFVSQTIDTFCRERRVVDKSGRTITLDPATEAFLRRAYFQQHRSSDVTNPSRVALEGEINAAAGTLTNIICINPSFVSVKAFLFDNVTDIKKKNTHLHLTNYPNNIEKWQIEVAQDLALQQHAERIMRFHAKLREGQHR